MITYELSGLFHVPANCANDGGGGGGDGFHLLESSSSSFPSSGRGAAGGRRASLISLQICTNALFEKILADEQDRGFGFAQRFFNIIFPLRTDANLGVVPAGDGLIAKEGLERFLQEIEPLLVVVAVADEYVVTHGHAGVIVCVDSILADKKGKINIKPRDPCSMM